MKNGSFEGGFSATEVANNWFAFNNDGVNVMYSYHDDTWPPVTIGCHSQLIEIDTRRFSATTPDRFSGIAQTVTGLTAGVTYLLTLNGEIRTSEGDENTDNQSYIVEWGIASNDSTDWQAVSSWQRVPWNHVDFLNSAGPMNAYTTTIIAPSSTLTLFIRLYKKWPRAFNELTLNLDNLSLSGPK